MDEELAVSGRRLGSLGLDLAGDVAGFARSCAAVDRWVGRVGSAFALADAGVGPTWVDWLSDAEATSLVVRLGGQFSPTLRSLGEADRRALAATFFPLWSRVRTLWPEHVITGSRPACAARPTRPAGVDDALDVLTFPDRSRRTDVVTAFLDGFVLGEFDRRGFDNASAEWARAIGHAVSGFFAVGDARDLAADVVHGDWLAAVLDGVALLPVAGDLLKVGREGLNVADGIHDVQRAAVELAGHADVHVGRSVAELEERLARAPRLKAMSSFPDWATAQQAADEVVARRGAAIQAWLADAGPRPKAFSADLGRPTGLLLERGAALPAVVTGARLIVVRDDSLQAGYRVVSAFPVR